jgi:hypothetical protein
MTDKEREALDTAIGESIHGGASIPDIMRYYNLSNYRVVAALKRYNIAMGYEEAPPKKEVPPINDGLWRWNPKYCLITGLEIY